MTASNKKKTKGTPDKIDVHVGNRLRIKRSLVGMSQEKLANAIGLTFQQVQKYERGLNRISAGRLYEFSRILEVPIHYFYENISNGEQAHGLSDNDQALLSPDTEVDMMQKKETLNLVRAYYSIDDPEARKDIVKFIKSMSQKMSKS